MTRAYKEDVRIQELSQELEVRAKVILDLLPYFGITEKKTHSSSIPHAVAFAIRLKLRNISPHADTPSPRAAGNKQKRGSR
jgi:translation initiation factor IF-2